MRSRRHTFAATADPSLMQDLNTTPLIDVMLVLLVMFIMVIPIQLSETPLDLPVGEGAPAEPQIHRLSITADNVLLWDGAVVSEASLPARFSAMARDPAAPVLEIATDGSARYEIFSRTLSAARKAGVNRLGMIGNEQFLPAVNAP